MRRSFNNKLHQIINESVKDALNEISWQKSSRAANAANERGYCDYADKVLDALDVVKNYISSFCEDDYHNHTQAAKLIPYVKEIEEFVRRKAKQMHNLEKLDYDNFKKQHNGVDMYDFEREVENTEEEDWTPSQREYAEFHL